MNSIGLRLILPLHASKEIALQNAAKELSLANVANMGVSIKTERQKAAAVAFSIAAAAM